VKTASTTISLDGLRRENPKKFVSLVRLAWPDIEAALERGHSVKTVHDRFVKGGTRISYRLFAMYVGQMRRETAQRARFLPQVSERFETDTSDERGVALVRVPKRRVFSAKAAAQYLGIHERTLKKITDRRELPARMIGQRRVYCLEDLNRYVESLPLSA
jgi:excisionase family DNA binding protein